MSDGEGMPGGIRPASPGFFWTGLNTSIPVVLLPQYSVETN